MSRITIVGDATLSGQMKIEELGCPYPLLRWLEATGLRFVSAVHCRQNLGLPVIGQLSAPTLVRC
ncbi:hypothetical protein E2C01_027600 [Portunus trituberculatus]|uniref:Uncharacterized protein n=1 Tax=Portunus trituberculatus TaxID=210409 RepID=A0A5B7ELR0_PORTR|nr:hypothetical protein [Portunus trituberculatus]